jgi:hypothetical protein
VSYKAAVISDSPVAYWRLGESSPSDPAKDEIDGNAGVYTGTPTVGVAGLLVDDSDKAVQLTGDGSFVDSIDIPALDQPAEFTLECLIKTANDVGGKCFISVTLLGASDKYLLFTDTGKDLFLQVVTADGPQNCGIANVLSAGSTFHVAGTYDSVSGDAKLYVNGTLVKSVTITGGVPLTGDRVWIGKATFGYPFNGVLDEVAVYDHVLSGTRIGVHHTESLTPSTDNNDIFDQRDTFVDADGPFISGGH